MIPLQIVLTFYKTVSFAQGLVRPRASIAYQQISLKSGIVIRTWEFRIMLILSHDNKFFFYRGCSIKYFWLGTWQTYICNPSRSNYITCLRTYVLHIYDIIAIPCKFCAKYVNGNRAHHNVNITVQNFYWASLSSKRLAFDHSHCIIHTIFASHYTYTETTICQGRCALLQVCNYVGIIFEIALHNAPSQIKMM